MNRVRPFHCGTQYLDWENSNCCRCKKYTDDASGCEIMQALAYASVSDGTVSPEMAERMGYKKGAYLWPCAEVDWTDEWTAECFEREHQEKMFVEGL